MFWFVLEVGVIRVSLIIVLGVSLVVVRFRIFLIICCYGCGDEVRVRVR